MDTGTTLMILRNSTDSTDVVAACHYVCSSPETGGWVEFESAEFTIAGTKTFELQVVPQNAGYHSYVSGALTLPSPAPTIQRVQIHIEHRA